jgi:uncharacterized protein (TIGR03067 family)
MVVKNEKYTFEIGDMTETGTLKLDPSKTPATLDIKIADGPDKGKTQLAIYKLDGDTFTLCFARPEQDRPKEFTAKAGSEHAVFVFKRQK